MDQWRTRSGYVVHQLTGGPWNVYALTHGEDMIIVDTGRRYRWKSLYARIESLRFRSGPRALILTHTHFDHAENAARLKEAYPLKVIVHRSEKGFLRKGKSPLPAGAILPTRWLIRFARPLVQRKFEYRGVRADVLVDHRLDLGPFGFEGCILHTPGHSRGSMSIIVEDTVALVGDTLSGIFPGSVMPPYADDVPLMIDSWRMLLETPCEHFLPGHGREIHRALLERKHAKYQRRLSRGEDAK
jgi:hydroxyacylglutathione hydrolase